LRQTAPLCAINISSTETGGVLLGSFDLNLDAAITVDIVAAPPDSRGDGNSFDRGTEDLQAFVNRASERTVGTVNYIGERHSHPPGHTAKASTDDYFQLIYLALGMSEDGLPALSLIIGESDDIQIMYARAV
jgi:integrative and conjugative element protein (TIGR02256 family)